MWRLVPITYPQIFSPLGIELHFIWQNPIARREMVIGNSFESQELVEILLFWILTVQRTFGPETMGAMHNYTLLCRMHCHGIARWGNWSTLYTYSSISVKPVPSSTSNGNITHVKEVGNSALFIFFIDAEVLIPCIRFLNGRWCCTGSWFRIQVSQ